MLENKIIETMEMLRDVCEKAKSCSRCPISNFCYDYILIEPRQLDLDDLKYSLGLSEESEE